VRWTKAEKMDVRAAQDIGTKCRALARAREILGMSDDPVTIALKDAAEAIDDISATWYFGQYQAARSDAEQTTPLK